MKDFTPDTLILELYNYAVYTVLDPPRTLKGKLRLEGPKGGYVTTWWTKDTPNIRIIK